MHIYTSRHKVHFTKYFFHEVFFSRAYCTLIWSEELSFGFCSLWILFPFVFLICHIEKQKIFVCPLILWAFLHTTSFIAVFQSPCLSSACPLTLCLFLWLMSGFIVAIKGFLDSKVFFFLLLLFLPFFPIFHLQQDRPGFKTSTAVVTAVRPSKHRNLIPYW